MSTAIVWGVRDMWIAGPRIGLRGDPIIAGEATFPIEADAVMHATVLNATHIAPRYQVEREHVINDLVWLDAKCAGCGREMIWRPTRERMRGVDQRPACSVECARTIAGRVVA